MPNALEWQNLYNAQSQQALAPIRERIAENLANYRQEQADKRAQQGSEALANLQARAAMERTQAEAAARIAAANIEQQAVSERAKQAREAAAALVREQRDADDARSNLARSRSLEDMAIGVGLARDVDESDEALASRIAAAKTAEQLQLSQRRSALPAETINRLYQAAGAGLLDDVTLDSVARMDPTLGGILKSVQEQAAARLKGQYDRLLSAPGSKELQQRQALAANPVLYYHDQITNGLSDDGVLVAERVYDALKYNNLAPEAYRLPRSEDDIEKILGEHYTPYEDQVLIENRAANDPEAVAARLRLETYQGLLKAIQALAERVHLANLPQDGAMPPANITVSDPWGLWNKVTVPTFRAPTFTEDEEARLRALADLEAIIPK